jgi:GntR family transcriptional regulator, gluconate operon transcriptional repressor
MRMGGDDRGGTRALRPARADRLSEQVASQIADAILSGTLRQGEHLVEAEIAASLQVSKSPVREALRDLAAQGLVTIQPRRGAFVRSLTVRDMREISVFRAALEGLAINLSMASSDGEWTGELRAGIDAIRSARGNAEINRRHIALHHLLVARCDNSRVLGALDAIATQTQSFMGIVGQLYNSAEKVAADHEALLAAVATGEPEAVRRAVDDHILLTEQELEAMWRRGASRNGAGANGPATLSGSAASPTEHPATNT